MGISNSSAQWRQITSTLLANLLSIPMGMIFSWIMISFLQAREDTHLLGENAYMQDLTEVDAFRRLPFVCILVALPLGAYLSERFGRKMTLALSGIPFVICFVLIAVARNLLWTYTALTFGGAACALQFYVVPMYVHEISSGRRSGAHGVIQTMFVGIGMFLGQVLPQWWRSTVVALLSMILLVGYMVIMAKLPESPVWFEKTKQTTRAKRVRTMLKLDDQSPPEDEAEKLNEEVENVQPMNSVLVELKKIFKCPGAGKGLLVSAGLFIGQAFLQLNVFNTIKITAQEIYNIAPDDQLVMTISSLTINISILIFVCMVSSCLIDRIGRRPLLIFSYLSIIIILALTCTIIDMRLMVIVVILYNIFYFLGLSALSVSAVEIIPNNVVSYVYAISMEIFWIATWIVFEIFRSHRETINGVYVWLGQIFISVVVFVFVHWCVPETKGKSSIDGGRVWSRAPQLP